MAVPFKPILAAAAILAIVLVAATTPSAPVRLTSAPGDRPLRGAFHVHTTRSDGALAKHEVAAAGARAGLDFIVFADHGDGTLPPDEPSYLHDVLCLDGVEISTNEGHYVAVGMAAAPYPLGGDAEAVVEDVGRLGGLGIAAHPSSRRQELAWSDWRLAVDGLEWLNADSEWRDERRVRLLGALLQYLWRPAGALGSLLDRPDHTISIWDQLTSERRVTAIAGHDAHGGFGAEAEEGRRGRRLHLPSYEASFRTFAVYVAPGSALTGNPRQDAEILLDAVRAGRVFTAIDALATPPSFEFRAVAGGQVALPGDVLPADLGRAHFSVRAAAPPGARTLLLRDGRTVAETSGGALDHEDAAPGAYRVEIHVPDAPGTPAVPWVLSNPVYRFSPARPRLAMADSGEATSKAPLGHGTWRAEASQGSSASLHKNDDIISLAYALAPADELDPFVALAAHLESVPKGTHGVVFRARADRPMRLSVQLRFAEDDGQRWGRSVYLDTAEREVTVPFGRLRAAGAEPSMPPVERATSVLFVVDRTNARPGDRGTFTLAAVALEQTGS